MTLVNQLLSWTVRFLTCELLLICLLQGLPVKAEESLATQPATAATSVSALSDAPTYYWRSAGKESPRAAVILVHGISQRAQSMRVLADRLSTNGFDTYAVDVRGHGWWRVQDLESDKTDGFNCQHKQSVEDVNKLVAAVRERHPGLPVFLVGESLGAAIALRAAAQFPNSIDGLVLCSAGSKARSANPLWLASDFAKGLIKRPVNIVRYQKKYGTDDLSSLEESLRDPLQRKTYRVSELLHTRSFLRRNGQYARQLNPEISVLTIQGSDDRTLSIKSLKKVFNAIPAADKELVIVPNCGHMMIGLRRLKPQIGKAIVNFIDDRTNQKMQTATIKRNVM